MSAPSVVLAHVLVDELVRAGVRDAVVCPGSRSAPLALALHAADRAGRLRLHVRLDERGAGFLALGLARGAHRPVPVVTTSGTAVANLHPAVLEASHAGVPLVVLSADRPAELRGTGANQVTDQVKIFGDAVRAYAEVPAPDVATPTAADGWRAMLSRLLVAATTGPCGPVHLDVALRPPLVADVDPADPDQAPAGRDGGAAWLTAEPATVEAVPLPVGPRTVVVAGDDAGPAARRLAEDAGWPLLAEPTSGARTGAAPVAAYRLLLDHPDLGGAVERVVVCGHPTLSRPVTALLDRRDVEVVVVAGRGRPTLPIGASRVVPGVRVPDGAAGHDHPGWAEAWREAGEAAYARVLAVLDVVDADDAAPAGTVSAHRVARTVWDAVPPGGLLVVGSSNPVRDLDLVARPHPVGERRLVVGNRGLAGIDGTLSTAIGVALGRTSSRAYAYVGDLTFVHDLTGLVAGPTEPRPDLTIVVANDDGGSIFTTLEQGGPAYADSFERMFATPTGVDLGAVCGGLGVPHRRVTTAADLAAALATPTGGVEVVEVPVDRGGRRDLDARLRACAP